MQLVETVMSLLGTTTTGVIGAAEGAAHQLGAEPMKMGPLALLIPVLPLVSVVLITLCAVFKVKSKLPAWITVASLAAAFGVTVSVWQQVSASPGAYVSFGYEWISFEWGKAVGQSFAGNFSLYIDQLTCYWMLFVTGLGALIALYASEYMSHDVGPGYNRFFMAFSLFVFSMACLVMGDNLLMLFLGWEGVGLCSYLLIGYFYQKPAAVDAAKKAFVVNRIGDLGLLMGLLTTFAVFGSIEYKEIFKAVSTGYTSSGIALQGHWSGLVIPALLTAGAFGKSAQLFFYVWLPDAMEGPTPVSALIHAATMVTAGVYLIARMFPVYTLDANLLVLSGVAWAGAITAFWAATIAMAQFDIKRIMGYSTISQLGFMFAGLGVLTTTGATFHVLTHAFFKATLFLCCGAVMHGFAGQLDLRKLSGVMWMKGWGLVGVAMLIGCLNLAGFAFTAGFFSKDMILAQAFVTPDTKIVGSSLVGWLLLLTALLTAYYTFRVFFRVFVGPVKYEPGDEHHGADDHGHGHDAHGHDGHGHGAGHDKGHDKGHGHDAHGHGHGHGGEFHPHAPGWAINFVLAVLAVASIAAAGLYFVNKDEHGWAGHMMARSSAKFVAPGEHHGDHAAAGHAAPAGEKVVDAAHASAEGTSAKVEELGTFLGQDPHKVMYYVSGVLGLIGIGVAFLLHKQGRTEAATSPLAEKMLKAPIFGTLAPHAQRKWYVDEVYNFLIRVPLLVLGHIFHIIDKLFVDGLVNLAGAVPVFTGHSLRSSQSGVMHRYAAGMAVGVGLVLLLAVLVMI